MRLRGRHVRLQVSGWFLLVVAASAASAADRALLIGINDYVDQRIPDLRGCEPDVDAMRRLLTDDYAFDPAGIRILLSRAATRRAILGAIDEFLVDGTQPGDRVLFYYSGHGSQQPAAPGKPDEPDGQDEILCCTDYDPVAQTNCIVDDEISERLARLDGRNVVVIVDACHSGSITKTINRRVRGVEVIDTAQSVPKYIPPPARRGTRDIFYRPPAPYAANSPTQSGAGQHRSDGRFSAAALVGAGQIVDEVRANYVALSGCGDAQTAEEIRVRTGERFARRGAFSWLLVEGLSGAADADGDDRVSYQEIIAHVEQRLRDPRIDLPQKPELRTRRAFFAQPFLGRVLSSRGLPKVIDVADGVVTINRGGQHGIASRQTYEPARGEPSSDDGMIRIETVEQFIATGRIEGPLDVNSGDALRPVETQYRPGAIAVWIAPPVGVDDPPRWRARVGECLQDIAGVNLTDDPAAADRTILIEQKLGRISAALYSRYGTLRARREYSGVSELLDDLPKRVIGELLITQLARLESRDSDLHLRLWVEGDRTSFIAYQDEDKQETIRFGFRASADCYLTLISIDSIGEIRWNLLEPGFRARAGVEYSLPPKDEEPLYVFPPAGRDFVYALATPQPVETGRLGTKAVSQQGTGEAIDLLTRAIGRRQRRSTENQPSLEAVVQLARDGWGAALVTIDTLAEE